MRDHTSEQAAPAVGGPDPIATARSGHAPPVGIDEETTAAPSPARGALARKPGAPPRLTANPSAVALLVWLACLPVAFRLPAIRDMNPFDLRDAMVPVVAGAAGLAFMAIAARWARGEMVSGVAAGLLAGWTAFTMRVALHGTPFGFAGLRGDAARLTVMANRYAGTWHSADGIVPSVPSDYPPLFPWLIGRTAAIAHTPAWRLLSPAETIAMSAAVVVGFALWRRMLPGPVALAVSLPALVSFPMPAKAYEVVALVVLAPWTLATFGRPPRGRLGWLPAGVIGGLSVALYQGYLMFAALGIAVLIVITWRASTDRAKYARHVALTVAVAAVVSSWYLVPYAAWGIMHGLQQVNAFQGGVSAITLPFLAMTPLAVLELVGLGGLVWYRRRTWWATPLLLLTASSYAYWFVLLTIFTLSGHTDVLQDTHRLIEPLLAIAGVLTIVKTAPVLVRRLADTTALTSLSAAALFLLVAWTGVQLWQAWMPGGPPAPGGQFRPAVNRSPNAASDAFAWPLPDGRYPRFGPPSQRVSWYPVDPIAADVRSVLGPDASPVTLSVREITFAYLPWPGYIAVDKSAAGANTRWFARLAALERLAGVTNPAAFASQSAHTPFGPIDVFILRRARSGWTWTPGDYSPSRTVVFSPAQFSPTAFAVFTDLPQHIVVAVRLPPS